MLSVFVLSEPTLTIFRKRMFQPLQVTLLLITPTSELKGG
jgi:hypothetical protein